MNVQQRAARSNSKLAVTFCLSELFSSIQIKAAESFFLIHAKSVRSSIHGGVLDYQRSIVHDTQRVFNHFSC